MKIPGFNEMGDTVWDTYIKDYELIRVYANRHRRNDPEGIYSFHIADIDSLGTEVVVKYNVDEKWIEEFDKLMMK